MWVVALKQARPSRGTGRGSHMALLKMDTFPDQSVEVGRVHVVVTKLGDRVVPLLVGNDKDDVRLFRHGCATRIQGVR